MVREPWRLLEGKERQVEREERDGIEFRFFLVNWVCFVFNLD